MTTRRSFLGFLSTVPFFGFSGFKKEEYPVYEVEENTKLTHENITLSVENFFSTLHLKKISFPSECHIIKHYQHKESPEFIEISYAHEDLKSAINQIKSIQKFAKVKGLILKMNGEYFAVEFYPEECFT